MPEAVSELWRRVSSYLDHALGLDTSGVAQWLATLDNANPELAAELRELLSLHAANCASGFMERSLLGPEVLIGQRIGPYAIEELLGRGGMGSVWLGRRSDGKFEGLAAIKLLERWGLGPESVEQVRHEASLLARLSHPHIARLFDAGVREDGQPYLILEYIEGLHIDRYCSERKLAPKERLRLFCDVLDAVAHAHSQLVVHRDLKPSNVLVTAEGIVKLLDFGVAVIQPQELQRLQNALLFDPQGLTPAYAAPEQIRGEPVSTAADVYSLGVLLHVLVTGVHPRAAIGPAAMQLECKTLAVPASQRFGDAAERRRVRGDLDAIIAHALEDDPARRYASAAAFAADIRAYLGNRPVRARPATRTYEAQKFVQRHRAATLASLFAVAVLIGASVVTTLQTLDARRQRDFAFTQLGRAGAINDFKGYIMNADPAGTLLARAEHVLEREHLIDANRVALLASVGWEYAAQGYQEKGLRLLTEAYRLSRQVADPSVRAQAACNLANALAYESPTPRSSQLIEEALRELPQGPEFALDRSACLAHGREVAYLMGDAQLALQRAQAAIQALKQVPFAHDVADLYLSQHLASALSNTGRYREAIAAYADGWTRMVALGRDDTAGAGILLNNWAVALDSAGRPLDAEPLIRRSMEIKAASSEKEPFGFAGLAQILIELGRPQEAIGYAERACRAAMEVNNPRALAQSQEKLSRAYRMLHDLPRAAQLLDEAEAGLHAALPAGHRLLGVLAADRALLAREWGEPGVALTLIDHAIQICGQAAQRGLAGAQDLPDLLGDRAMIEIDAGAYPAAEVDARRALKLLDAPPDQYSSYGGRAHLALARVLSAQGKTAEARQQAQEAARQLEKAVGPGHPDTRAAREMSGAAPPS